MPPARVVPTLNPGKDRQARLDLGLPTAPGNQLTFQAWKEAPGHGVVVGIAHGSHGRSHAHFLAAVAKGRGHGSAKGSTLGARVESAADRQQIASRFSLDYPDDKAIRISHEAIYQSLSIHGRAALPREPSMSLRGGWPLRVLRVRSSGRGKSLITPDVMISHRLKPGISERRLAIGRATSFSDWKKQDPLHDAAAPTTGCVISNISAAPVTVLRTMMARNASWWRFVILISIALQH